MIIKNKYPICEYDTSTNPIIKPTDFLEKRFLLNVSSRFLGKNLISLLRRKISL